MKVFFSADYRAAAESFDTTRKSAWIAESLERIPIAGVELTAPEPLTFDYIATVHDPKYVEAVKTGEPRELAVSQGFEWDPGMWRSVTASNGGVVAAALAAMTEGVAGSLSSGMHHARRARGASFCTFNGLAIAAKKALDAGVRSVWILDLDAHCGGGTHSLIRHEPRIRQTDVSVSRVDPYNPAEWNTLDMVSDASTYLDVVRSRLADLEKAGQMPGLCLYNAGMDPDARCVIGGLRGMAATMLREREDLVFGWCRERGIPVAFVLAGGYESSELSRDSLVALHRMTIEAGVKGPNQH